MRHLLLLIIGCLMVGPASGLAQEQLVLRGGDFAAAALSVVDPPPEESTEAGNSFDQSPDEETKDEEPEEESADEETQEEETKDEDAADETATDSSETGDKQAADDDSAMADPEDQAAGDSETTDSPAGDQGAGEEESEPSKKSGKKQAEGKKETEDAESKESSSDQGASAGKKAEREKPAEPYLIKRQPLKVEVELAGTFVTREMVEIALRPKVWAQFKVLEAVPHGAKVHKGDVLIRFDEVKIEETLADKSLSQRLAELDLMMAEEELPRLEKMTAIDYENSQKAYKELTDEYERFKQTLRPLSEKIADFNFQAAKESLAMEQEELDQLQQMYEADDLTEETEKIVLHRQQFAVEMARLYVEYAQFNHKYTLNVTLPRREEQMALALEQSQLGLERAKMAKSLGLNKVRYELEKKRALRARSLDQHARLLGDRALMVLKAPADGVVYYGRCLDGKWSSVSSLRAKLKPFGSVTPGTVLFTLVQPGSLSIVATVSEKNFPQIHAGLTTTIVPTGDAELEWEGKVAHVDSVPSSRGKFPLRIDFNSTSAPDWLVPDMTCKAKVTTYENKEAILIPRQLVETDKENKKRKYVLVLDEDEDEPVRRKVKLGRHKGSLVEIVKGLKAGEKLLKPAKEKKKK